MTRVGHYLSLGLLILTSALTRAQSCTRTSCTTQCLIMDGPIDTCNWDWQGRGSSSLETCVCNFHDNTVDILAGCVACNNSTLGSNHPLAVYQAWYVLCNVLRQKGESAAVSLENVGKQGGLVPVFSQTYLGPIETALCSPDSGSSASSMAPSYRSIVLWTGKLLGMPLVLAIWLAAM